MSLFSSIDNLSLTRRVAWHALFWCVVEIAMAYHGSLYGGDFYDNLIKMLVLMPVHMVAAYSFVYWQVPLLLLKRRTLRFIVSFLLIGYLLSVLSRWLMIHVAEPLIYYEGIDESLFEIMTDPIYLLRSYWVVTYIPAAILFLIKMTKERYIQQKEVDQLIQEKKTAELNFLKAQMNPHFLFNTLNNIYSLSKSQAEDTPDMILKLSDILDYTIYECQADRVSVQKEWELIENYIDLQAVRYHRPLDIQLSFDSDDISRQIAPLILITLVENAFKYATQSNLESPFIHIHLTVNEGELQFEIKNSQQENSAKQSKDRNQGIGISNVQKQLTLLYPKRHTYRVEQSATSYHVNLLIQL